MARSFFLLLIVYPVFVFSSFSIAADKQSWKVRAGDSLDSIAMTLEIPKEEIRKHNPGIQEVSLQIGQKLNLPLQSYEETRALEQDRARKAARIVTLERANSDLEKNLASVESQLRWQPVWFWGFWVCFGIIAFIGAGAYWIFRQTHPRVFDEPHDRSLGDLRESQMRVRSFPREDEGVRGGRIRWEPALKRAHAHR